MREGRKRIPKEILIVIGPSIAYVTLSQGLFALINSDDIPLIGHLNWYAHYDPLGDRYYAYSNDVGGKTRKLHRMILDTALLVDHRNRNSLDNRRQNLRAATPSQNQANAKTKINSATGFKGVWLDQKRGKYLAYVIKEGKTHYAGTSYNSALEASAARQAKAQELFGDFAR